MAQRAFSGWVALAIVIVFAGEAWAAPATEPGFLSFLREAPLVSLFVLLAVGLRLGRIEVAGVSLGTSAVLFVGLLFGHMHFPIPSGLGTFGLVLFVYAVGLSAGPGFFRAFVSQGKDLAKLAVVIVGLGSAVTLALTHLLGIPVALGAGMMAGALTSTPGLAAASEALTSAGADAGLAAVGYGLAYPFGVVGVVLAVQLLPRLLGVNLDEVAHAHRGEVEEPEILKIPVVIENPAVFGRTVVQLEPLAHLSCQVTRLLQHDRMEPIPSDHVLQQGDVVLLIADSRNAELALALLGAKSDVAVHLDTDRERAQIVVTNPKMFGQTLAALRIPMRFGVTLSRIVRYEMPFVPNSETRLRPGDQVYAVGTPQGIEAFMSEAGHRSRALHETDLASLAVALLIGLLLGLSPVVLPGGEAFRLGLAGGPLLVGLVLGHFGRLGALNGYVPRAARLIMGELGLALFLTEAGVNAGQSFLQTVQQHGLLLFAMGAAVTLVSMLGGLFVAVTLMRLDWLRALGGICGGMTSTPGIGAITQKTESDLPVVSYAAAYPVALVLMGISAQIIVSILL